LAADLPLDAPPLRRGIVALRPAGFGAAGFRAAESFAAGCFRAFDFFVAVARLRTAADFLTATASAVTLVWIPTAAPCRPRAMGI
jgi:hypothetical protein